MIGRKGDRRSGLLSLSYVHGQYFTIGEKTGSFGFSVRKK